jgi:phage/plasmid-like protein (TIGR03299 family)
MSHEFETGLYIERPAWHGLGLVLDADHGMSTSELVAKAFPGPVEGMAAKWQLAPTHAEAHGTTYPTGQACVVRDVEPHIIPNSTGSLDRMIRQPGENAELLQNALGGLGWLPGSSMISLREGARIVLLAKLTDEIKVGGTDAVNLYAVCFDSYDGTLPLTFGTTAVRVVCQNTLNMALPDVEARPHVKIKHTKNANVKVGDVQAAMSVSFKWAEEFERTANLLSNTEVTKRRFEDIVREAFPMSSADRAKGRNFSDQQYAMIGVRESSPTIGDDIRDTGWGALNAVSEFLEWGRGSRNTTGAEADSEAATTAMAERRFESTLTGGQADVSKVASLILA